MMEEKTKICKSPNCGAHPLNNFYINRTKSNGETIYFSLCKKCHKQKSTQYSKNNPEIVKQIRKKYNKNNQEKIKEYSKNYDFKEIQKRSYDKNKQKIFIYKKNRRKYDPIFKLTENIRKRIYSYIKNDKIKNKTNYLGCSIEEYKKYLEHQFTPEMSWGNYGSYWEIDHISSLYNFDFTNELNIFKAFHFTNTRPLSIKENRSRPKKNKI
jgi:hypothetical protein